MTALFKNSIMMILAAGILLIAAGSALAAPGDAYYPGQNLQIDPETAAQLQDMIESGQLQLAVPEEDEDYIVPPDEPADDGQVPEDDDDGVEPGEPGDEPGDEPVPGDDEPGFDNPDDSDNPNNPNLDNPGNPDTSGNPPVADQPPATTGTPGASSKLPNTGSHLAVIAGLGLALAGAAVAVRRFVVK